MIYRQVSVKWPKSIAVETRQLPLSLWLGLQASWSHQTWHGHGQGMGLGATVVRLIVPHQGSAVHRHDLLPS